MGRERGPAGRGTSQSAMESTTITQLAMLLLLLLLPSVLLAQGDGGHIGQGVHLVRDNIKPQQRQKSRYEKEGKCRKQNYRVQ